MVHHSLVLVEGPLGLVVDVVKLGIEGLVVGEVGCVAKQVHFSVGRRRPQLDLLVEVLLGHVSVLGAVGCELLVDFGHLGKELLLNLKDGSILLGGVFPRELDEQQWKDVEVFLVLEEQLADVL